MWREKETISKRPYAPRTYTSICSRIKKYHVPISPPFVNDAPPHAITSLSSVVQYSANLGSPHRRQSVI